MAITTVYEGVEYRSRLEARWAAFFWRLGWPTTYEPFDGDGYIPDFVINGTRPLLVEIKPAVTLTEYEAPITKITRGIASYWEHDVVILGIDPIPALLTSTYWPDRPALGLLGQNIGNYGDPSDWDFQPALWITCTVCDRPAVFHPVMDFTAAPCGHHEGDGHLGLADTRKIRAAWDAATNDVKWRGRAA